MIKMLRALIWISFTILPFGICDICSPDTVFGVNDDKLDHDHEEKYDSGTGNAYMLGDPAYVIDCCGVVTQWQARIGVAGTIHFQIWRPNGTEDEYELVGENEYTVDASEASSSGLVGPKSIAASSRISVKENDRIGWWSSGNDQLYYWKQHNEGKQSFGIPLSRATLGSGSPISWSTASKFNNRRYNIQLTAGQNTSPSFTNIPDSSTTVSELTNIGTNVYTVSFTDVNSSDIPTMTVAMTTDTYFSFNSSTKRVKVERSLVGAPNTVDLDFTVTDQCGNTDSGTLTIAITHVPPTIHNLPFSATISEAITTLQLLHTLNVTDPTDSIECGLATTGVPFTVKQIESTIDWGIYLKDNPNLHYATQNSYTLTIECDDSKDTVSGAFDVNVTPNAPPTILDLANSTSVSTFSTNGSVVFEVLASDPEEEQLFYNMTCDPSPCPFIISASGVITHTNLTGHTTPKYQLSVYVYDGSNLVGPHNLTINVTDINHVPVINNVSLSTSVSLPENSAVGTSVFAVNATDEDVSDVLTYSMTSSPVTGITYFRINSTTGLISLNSNIDFEAMPAANFSLKITVTDGNATTIATIQIVITDENEAPSFNQTSYSITGNEGPAGTELSDAGFSISDDAGDTHNFTLSCVPDNSYFVIDPNNGTITYASDYDLDDGSRPTNVTCYVTVTDSGGLIDTALLTIIISAVNDNCPEFSPNFYSLSASYGAAVGTTLGAVTASDGDTGADGLVMFSLNQSHLEGVLFNITSTGDIYKADDFPTNYSVGITVNVKVTATDTGSCSDLARVNISVLALETTTERFRTFFEEERNIVWVSLCVVTLAVTIVVLIHWARHPTVFKVLFGCSPKRKGVDDVDRTYALRTDTTETTDCLVRRMNKGRWVHNGVSEGEGREWLTNQRVSMSSSLNGQGKRAWIPSPILLGKGGEPKWISSPIMMNMEGEKTWPPSPVMSNRSTFFSEGESEWTSSSTSDSSISSPRK